MADFVQTMKDWKRMCSAMEKLRPNDPCAGCRLEGYGCPAIYEDNSHVDFHNVEKQVSAWAAEHPEPVYPNWIDWLMSESVIPTNYMAANSTDSGVRAGMFYVTSKAFEPIPADIAEKLGVEPKEGV